MTRAELAEYADRVFREHNRAYSRLIEIGDAIEADDPALHEEIAAAERNMLEACADLNRIAAYRRDQRRPPAYLQRRIPSSIGACEQATRKLLTLLPEK